jgi:hypothetical protein
MIKNIVSLILHTNTHPALETKVGWQSINCSTTNVAFFSSLRIGQRVALALSLNDLCARENEELWKGVSQIQIKQGETILLRVVLLKNIKSCAVLDVDTETNIKTIWQKEVVRREFIQTYLWMLLPMFSELMYFVLFVVLSFWVMWLVYG